MKMKVHRILFSGLITLVTGTIIGGIGLNSTNHFSENNRAISSTLQKNLSLDVKQQNSISENNVGDSTKDLEFEYDSTVGGYSVTGFNSSAQIGDNYTLIIPKMYAGDYGKHPVITIKTEAFSTKKNSSANIKRINCGAVETIEDKAFSGCSHLDSITLGDKLDKLQSNVFQGCNALKSITIPKSTGHVFAQAFSGCELEKIIILCSNECNFADGWLKQSHNLQNDGAGSKKTIYVLDESVKNKIKTEAESAGWKIEQVTKLDDKFVVRNAASGQICELIGLTTSAINKENLTIPREVTSIDDYAFFDRSENLAYVTFQQTPKIRTAKQNAFHTVPEKTHYRVYNDVDKGTVSSMLETRGLKKRMILYENEGDFIKQSRPQTSAPSETSLAEIGGLTKEGAKKEKLTIKTEFKSIGAYAFGESKATDIEFEPGVDLSIDDTAFKKSESEMEIKTIYHTNTDKNAPLVKALENKVTNKNDIAVTVTTKDGIKQEITLGGTLIKARIAAKANATSDSTSGALKKSDVLLIDEKIDEITLTGIGHKAFQDCDDIRRVEFAEGVSFSGGSSELYEDSFKGLKNDSAVICAYDTKVVKKIADVYGGKVGAAEGEFFYNKRINTPTILGLTQKGRNAKSLHINAGTVDNDAFFGCSKNVVITVDSGVKFEDNAIRSIPKDVLDSIKWDIKGNSSVREYLKGKVPEKNIKYTAGGLSGPIIGTIVGSICVAIIILGLGIGIPMRKQNKINVLNAKLTHKRIDKLSTANSLAFKKVIEVTGNLDKKVDRISSGLKALKAASRPTKPAVKKADGTTTSATTVVKKAAAPKTTATKVVSTPSSAKTTATKAVTKTTATKVVAAKTATTTATEATKEDKK